MMSHWIDKKFESQNRVVGCWLREGDSEPQTLQDEFIEALIKKCKILRENIVAVVSDTTSNMNKFGTLLEKLDIPNIYSARIMCCRSQPMIIILTFGTVDRFMAFQMMQRVLIWMKS